MAHGKTVLFISEKKAALEVVRKRLADINLGAYCLEVHSDKARKTEVIEQHKAPLAVDVTRVQADGPCADLPTGISAYAAGINRKVFAGDSGGAQPYGVAPSFILSRR
jgi:hypothetical protein